MKMELKVFLEFLFKIFIFSGEAHELHPPIEDKPGIIVHVCEECQICDHQGGARPRITQTRRPPT